MHLLLLAAVLAAQPSDTTRTPPDQVTAMRLPATGITLDGRLDEETWRLAPPAGELQQRDPVEGAAPSQRSDIRIVYDNEAVYIGARLFDTHPDSVVALLARRDGQAAADRFLVFIDSYHDRRTGYYFGVNAAGTLYDGTLYNDDWDDDTWDGVWQGAVHRDSLGWSAELRIPYSQLRFRQSSDLTWGINFKREIARRNEQDYLVYVPSNQSGFVSRFPVLTGLAGIRPPRRLEVLPYVTARSEHGPVSAGNPFRDGSLQAAGAGADVKFGLGSNLTLDATVNPDFGQVEVDPAVVNLSDFETFFDEKRPFFIEGADIFHFGQGGSNNFWGFNWGSPSFFYSRRIGRTPQGAVPSADHVNMPSATSILGAVKLSGRLRPGWSIGALQAVTQREFADLDVGGVHGEAEVEPLAYYGVVRSSLELGEGRAGIGMISSLAVRDFDDAVLRDRVNSRSLGLGVDAWTFLDAGKEWALTGWFGGSRNDGSATRITALQRAPLHYFHRPDATHLGVDEDATSMSGVSGRILLNRQRGAWRFNAALGMISPGFDVSDLGFQFRSDLINSHLVTGYRWSQPGTLARRGNLNLATFRSWDFEGNTTWAGYFSSGWMQLHNYWELEGVAVYNPETINTRLTRGGPVTVNPHGVELGTWLYSDRRQALVFNAGVSTNQYAEGSTSEWNINAGVEWRPSSRILLSVSPTLSLSRTAAQYVGTYADEHATATFGSRYVFGALDQRAISASIRLNYIFSPTLSLQVYAQPLVSSNDFSDYKELAAPRSYDFLTYGEGGSTFDASTGTADPDGPGGPAAPISIGNRDFTFASLRGNAVLRWEYLPGSTFFLVWTQTRAVEEEIGNFGLGRSTGALFEQQGTNTVLAKVSWWWNP